jgi:hypothetical protein
LSDGATQALINSRFDLTASRSISTQASLRPGKTATWRDVTISNFSQLEMGQATMQRKVYASIAANSIHQLIYTGEGALSVLLSIGLRGYMTSPLPISNLA